MKRVLRRTLAASSAVVVLAATATGCSQTGSDTTIASVGDVTITRAEFERVAQAYRDRDDGATTTGSTGPVTDMGGPEARDLLRQLVLGELLREFLATRGTSLTDDELAAATVDEWAAGLPADELTALQHFASAQLAIGRGVADEAEATYSAAPSAESGVLCLSAILVETAEDAEAVVDELEGGADFAQLAAERSIDPAAAQTGGAQTDASGSECFDAAQIPPTTPVAQAALALSPGTWSGPLDTVIDQANTPGFLVLYARPYDEVADAVNARLGQPVVSSFVDTVEVEIDPMYGTWDPETLSVVAVD